MDYAVDMNTRLTRRTGLRVDSTALSLGGVDSFGVDVGHC